MSPRDAYVKAASPRYQDAHTRLARLVKRRLPRARKILQHGMPGWVAPRPPGSPRPARAGTLPPDRVYVFLAERKAGLTLHLWYPGDYGLLEKHKRALEEAGFKVMRGCLQFNRRGELPLAPVDALLARVHALDHPPARSVRRAS